MSILTREKIRSTHKLIVTSGPTREFIDSIRFLSNPSTGRMGYHVARAGVNMGYEVIYIHGPVPMKYQAMDGARSVPVISTIDMLNAVKEEMKDDSILIMTAAPADYRPEKKFEHKLKKKENPEIKLVQNPDILLSIQEYIESNKINRTTLIGFAAEMLNAYDYALSKLIRKKLDLIFLNDLSKPESGFGVDTNELTVIRADKTHTQWSVETKERLGYRIIQEVESWLL
ncbi:MAG: phosphopantothenoylcysteine decarboxylase [Leptospirales bacterium]